MLTLVDYELAISALDLCLCVVGEQQNWEDFEAPHTGVVIFINKKGIVSFDFLEDQRLLAD